VFAADHCSVQISGVHVAPSKLNLATSSGPPLSLHLEEGTHSEPSAGATLIDGLPPGSPIEIRVEGSALGGERRLTTATLPQPPGEILTRVATISDLHLGARAFGRRKTIIEDPEPDVAHPIRCSTAAIRAAATWGASEIVAKGDLTNNGHLDQWRSYAELVEASPVPVMSLPGNHDRTWKRGSAGLSPEDAAQLFGLQIASPLLVLDRPGVRLVLVDSTSGPHNRGSLVASEDDVVQAVAETEAGSVALVLMHHQLHQHPVHEGWPVGVHRGPTVAHLDRLASTGTPTLVSGGHTHRHRRWTHRGVVVTQVGSTKDYPGVWAGYTVSEGGISQVVRRVAEPDCIRWTDHTRRAVWGAWRWISPGTVRTRCFLHTW